MDSIDIADLDEKLRFRVKLEIALRSNAIRIQQLNSDPERFAPYITEREQRIRKLLQRDGDLAITEGGNRIFP